MSRYVCICPVCGKQRDNLTERCDCLDTIDIVNKPNDICVNEAYIVGFDLSGGKDISVAQICKFNPDKNRYEQVKTLYNEDAESLYNGFNPKVI